MIINRIMHHHIIHHQGIIYNILNLLNFSMMRNCEISSITTMISKIIIKMKRSSKEGERGSLTLTLIGEVDFWTLIEEASFLILFVTKVKDTEILMRFLILFLFLMGSLDVESTLLCIDEIDKLFDMEYIHIVKHVKFVTYKFKRRTVVWKNQLQNIRMYHDKPPIKMWRLMKRLL